MWVKKGLIYSVDKINEYFVSHTHKPTPLVLDGKLRIYFGTRDKNQRTRTTFIDVDLDEPNKILYIHDKPVLGLGKLGTFDDCGANVSCFVKKEDLLYMYYIGWNTSTTVPMRNSIGLAISEDGGNSFTRYANGPILDRNIDEPYFTVAPYVIIENNIWRMWYTSGTGWEMINNRPEIKYHIKYAESKDGIIWIRNNVDCIIPKNEFEAVARPFLLKENNLYKMWYCFRSIKEFRTNKNNSYRIGYAESKNGYDWIRLDEKAGIDNSEDGWDSQMIAYPAIYIHNGKKYMFYNGNNFGASGFGYAILDE